MGTRLVLAIAAAICLFSLDLSAQRRNGNGNYYGGITVYENPEFRGNAVTFRGEIPDLREYRLNDRITSFEVLGNQAWEVCRDVFFGGACHVFTGSIDDLREMGWNDRISSLRPLGNVRNNGGGWGGVFDNRNGNVNGNVNGNGRARGRANQSRLVLYDRTNFRGESRDVLNSNSNLGTVGDRARSVEVIGGTWDLCDGNFGNARCVTVSENVPDLNALGLRGGVSSVRER
jgi:hypothetical protein